MKLVKNDGRELIVELEGENFINPLIEELLRDERVEYAGEIRDHPLKTEVRIIVRTKEGSPEEALYRAIDKIRGTLGTLMEDMDGERAGA